MRLPDCGSTTGALPMKITVLTNRSPRQVHDDLSGFAVRYTTGWER